MSYVVVEDVAASWEHHQHVAQELGGTPPDGLILYVAGPTDEGFRTVGFWTSEAAWHRFAARLGPETEARRRVRRMLRPEHVVHGIKEER